MIVTIKHIISLFTAPRY